MTIWKRPRSVQRFDHIFTKVFFSCPDATFNRISSAYFCAVRVTHANEINESMNIFDFDKRHMCTNISIFAYARARALLQVHVGLYNNHFVFGEALGKMWHGSQTRPFSCR